MLTPRLSNCTQCSDIHLLIAEIDCKIFELSKILYNNIIYMLGGDTKCNNYVLSSLLHYKRILLYKVCNPNYAGNFTVNMISNKVKLLKYK